MLWLTGSLPDVVQTYVKAGKGSCIGLLRGPSVILSNSLCRARSRATRDEHRAWCQAHYPFGNTAQEYVLQTGPSMRSHDNKVNVVLLSHGNDARIRAPVFHQGLPLDPGMAHTLEDLRHTLLGNGLQFIQEGGRQSPWDVPCPPVQR